MSTAGQHQPIRERAHVLVVGAGATGLACAAALTARGVPAIVVERGGGVATAWRSRYRALRLNGGRPFSTLPGQRFPRGTPMFPSRDQVVRYLENYRARHGLRVHTGTRVTRLDRADGGWRLITSRGVLTAPQVIVATGLLARPYLPDELISPRSGPPVVHSADYVDAVPYRGCDVLVIGAGSSGMEIAHDLVNGGAGRVLLSVRTPPNLLPRSIGGLPGDPGVLLLRRLPPRIADAQLRVLRRLVIGDLASCGLPLPREGPFARLRRDPAGPAVVDREVVDEIRAGRIEVVPAVQRISDGTVLLDDGADVTVDAAVAATGFRTGLEPLVGHLGVLDASGVPTAFDERAALPGLRFANFRARPGLLGAAGHNARRTARAIAREVSVAA